MTAAHSRDGHQTQTSGWRLSWPHFSGWTLPAALLLLIGVCAIFGSWLAPYSPTVGSLSNTLRPPFWVDGGSVAHLLGTDHLGRDVLSRLLVGARTSLLVAISAVLVAGTIGTVVGLVAGYCGGIVEMLLMRVTDAILAIPYMLIALVFCALIGPSASTVVIVLGLTAWASYARVIRSEVLSLRERDFVTLATISNASHLRILRRHILPNIVGPLVVMATLQVGMAIILSASLSFLGMGSTPPWPEWGLMMSEGRSYMATAWWLTTFPGLMILITVLCVNLLGDLLRVKLDPKRRAR